MPFSCWGGLNNPQFSNIDLNNDGQADLFIFDRADNSYRIFWYDENTGNFIANNLLASSINFPKNLQHWVLLQDVNCDEVPDILTSNDKDGVSVFTGFWQGESLHFSLLKETLLFDDEAIYVKNIDIPAISDIDNDGDLDILSFEISGGFIFYYQNTDTQCNFEHFTLASACWGRVYESGLTPALEFDLCFEKSSITDDERHPGSTLLAKDVDGDGDKDVLLGDINYQNVVFLQNDGNSQEAIVNFEEIDFPANDIPAHVRTFPAVFEINNPLNTTQKALVVSPNAVVGANQLDNAWLYTCESSDDSCTYHLQTKRFMAEQMLDFNRNSQPVFWDYDKDGRTDLVVGNYAYIDTNDQFRASLALYRNVSSPSEIKFSLVDKDYQQIAVQFSQNTFALKPTFGDLDNDADDDMIIGDAEGRLHFFENQPENNLPHFILKNEAFFDGLQYATPQLFDLNNDGLLDLIAGNINGAISYWKNTGTAQNFVFSLETDYLGQVDVRADGEVVGYAVPQFFYDHNQLTLMVGSYSGEVFFYQNIWTNDTLQTAFAPMAKLSEINTDFPTMQQTSPSLSDINNDGLWDIACGNYRGGIYWFSQMQTVGISAEVQNEQLQIFPNPASGTATLQISTSTGIARCDFYNTQGQCVAQYKNFPSGKSTLRVKNLPQGIYFVHCALQTGEMIVRKLVVL